MRKAVSARERLIVTLRYMASGRSISDLKFSCAISPQLVRKNIPESCWALFKTLKEEYTFQFLSALFYSPIFCVGFGTNIFTFLD
nr:unnamed protein product [Callosobruchus analis]